MILYEDDSPSSFKDIWLIFRVIVEGFGLFHFFDYCRVGEVILTRAITPPINSSMYLFGTKGKPDFVLFVI